MRNMFMPGMEGGQQRQRTQQQSQQRSGRELNLSARQGSSQKQADSQQQLMLLKRALKKKRSANYMAQIQLLDAGGQALNEAAAKELQDEIVSNLGPLDPELGKSIGIISKCYLGDPYEVHTLDMRSNIIEHYPSGQALPGTLEKFRGMAMSGSYEFIEVYSSCACAVRSNGSVTIIDI